MTHRAYVSFLLLVTSMLSAAACSGGGGQASGGGGSTSVPKTCSNGQQDGDETDVDCGGGCAPCANFARCRNGDDCAVDSVCSLSMACHYTTECPYLCVPWRSVACEAMPCEAGQFCSDAGEGDSLCYPLAGPGEPCNALDPQSPSTCIEGYYCDEWGFPSICKAKANPGDPCDDSDECPSGHYCSGTCEKQAGEGQACQTNAGCAPGLYCDFAQAGQPRCTKIGGAGMPCHDAPTSCEPGLSCVFPPGLSCTNEFDCDGANVCCATPNGSACVSYTPTCKPPEGTCQ